MGIVRLYSWLKRKDYRGVIRQGVPSYVSSLSLELNAITHEVAQLVYAYGKSENPERRRLIESADPHILEAELYTTLDVKLMTIIETVKPQEILALTFDGVAPQAKIAQQRQRRFKAAMEKNSTNLQSNKKQTNGKQKSVFDSNCISPGTEFMKRLDNFMQRWLLSRSHLLPPKIIYSSHLVPGEGEHKIAEYMRSGEISGNGAHVIYGMDADLIMLAALSPVSNISLMREDISDVIDIDSFKTAIIEELGSSTAISDFVVMIFFIGNDFLPHMPALEDLDESIETIMRTYKMYGKPLTKFDMMSDKENNKEWSIIWENLKGFLGELAKEEGRLLELESMHEVKYPASYMNMATQRNSSFSVTAGVKNITRFDYNLFRGAWYQHIFNLRGNNSNKIFQKLLPRGYNLGTSIDKIVDLCKNYLVGMNWIFRYYTQGMSGINTDWCYTGHYTPMLTDLASVAKQLVSIEGYQAKPNMINISPVHQLLAIIPLRSKDLLPIETIFLTDKDSPIADLFPENAIIDREGKNNDWEGIVLIPFANMERIIKAVNEKCSFSEERIKSFSNVADVIVNKDLQMVDVRQRAIRVKELLSSSSSGTSTTVSSSSGGRGTGRGRGKRAEQQPQQKQEGKVNMPSMDTRSSRLNVQAAPYVPTYQKQNEGQNSGIRQEGRNQGQQVRDNSGRGQQRNQGRQNQGRGQQQRQNERRQNEGKGRQQRQNQGQKQAPTFVNTATVQAIDANLPALHTSTVAPVSVPKTKANRPKYEL